MNVRRTVRALLVMAAGSLVCFAPNSARSQDYSDSPPSQPWAHSYVFSAPGAYSNYGYPRLTINYGPFRSTGYSFYRPLQPDDWGYGPCGPRHNLNASQKSPSGMTWW